MNRTILDAIMEKLAQYPAVNFTRRSDAELEIYPRDERGFPIYIQLDQRENTLHFGSFHWHYDNTEEETTALLDHLMLGLTGLARVKEFARHGKAYKWVLEVQDQTGTWQPDGTMGTFSFNFWVKPRVRYLRNDLLPASLVYSSVQ
jgi:hypothetical protein